MTRINMTKYGFLRFPEGDFSDDGTRFYCFMAGDIIVTKATSNGEVFISGNSQPHGVDSLLTYKEASSLPHYHALDALNGISIDSLTDERLDELYQNCLEYSKEWHAAADAIQYPTRSEVWCQLSCLYYTRACELADVNRRIDARSLLAIPDHRRSDFFRYLGQLAVEASTDLEEKVDLLMGTRESRELVAKSVEQLKVPSFWYGQLIKLLGAE